MSDRSALADGPVGANPIEPRTYLVELKGITKAFGPTLAAADIDFAVAASDVVGLVGGNGAGKSTLMRILCGITAPTLGRLSFDGVEDSFTNYDAGAAQRRGIRMVHQELSLCATLTVAENFFVEDPQHASAKPGWRNVYRSAARAALDAVFPGNTIDVNARIDRLSIGERQMVEIARAAATPGVRLIVLDEPTSSLDLERSRQLRHYVRERARAGLAFIFISHKLHEIMDVASRVLVLRNGRVAWQGEASGASVGRLVELMGGDASVIHHRIEREARAEARSGARRRRLCRRRRASQSPPRGDCRPRGPRGAWAEGPPARHPRGGTRIDRRRDAHGARQLRVRRSAEGGRFPAVERARQHFDRSRWPPPCPRARFGSSRTPGGRAGRRADSARPHSFQFAHRRAQRRQSAEGVGVARRGGDDPDRAARRSDPRRRHRHEAGFLSPVQRARPRGPHLDLAHDGGCGAAWPATACLSLPTARSCAS